MTNNHVWPAVFQGEVLPDPDPDFEAPDADVLRRSGLAADRELHDWDGETGLVTSYVRCAVGDHHVWGAGIARDRAEAAHRALGAVYVKVASTAASASTK